MSLRDDFVSATTDEIEKYTHHFALYERYLGRLVNQPCVLFLIIDGTHALAQARMWTKFLGPASRVVGITDWEGDDHQVSFRCGKLRDEAFRRRLLAEFGPPTVVIDDGTHRSDDMIEAFESLQSHLPAGALYVIEDIHTAYSSGHNDGFADGDTIIAYLKAMIDELHAPHTAGAIPPNAFSRRICGIHVFDGLVVLECGQYLDRRSIRNRI